MKPPLMHALQLGDSDLGPFITTRKAGILEKIVVLFALALLMVFPVVGLILAGQQITTHTLASVLGTIICLALCLFCLVGMRSLFRAVDFHHNGAVERCFGKRREFRYDRADALSYTLTRQYLHGIYVGTSLSFRLATVDRRVLRLSTRYKEQAKGLSIIGLGRKFVGEDEMDVIRDLIAAHIANRMTANMQPSGYVDWGRARLSTEGLTPLRGKHKHELIPWSRLRMTANNGFLSLFASEQRRPFLTVPCGGHNFYPAMQLIASLAASAPAEMYAAA
jgi:hypothetical protein